MYSAVSYQETSTASYLLYVSRIERGVLSGPPIPMAFNCSLNWPPLIHLFPPVDTIHLSGTLSPLPHSKKMSSDSLARLLFNPTMHLRSQISLSLQLES